MNDLTDLPLGQALRDAALATHKVNHAEDVRRVREELARRFKGFPGLTFTSDVVSDVVEQMGLGVGDTRWTGSILKGWGMVHPTDQFVPSRRKSRHAAPVRVWVWL